MNFKRGFSLAELLLAVGIIGIITAMGMTITKHTAEKAYNGYWYTGYINLYNAIGDFNQRGLFDLPEEDQHLINDTNSMARELRGVFNASGEGNEVIARNGIRYTVTERLLENPEDTSTGVYFFSMTVPQARTRSNPNGRAGTNLTYIQSRGLLVPLVDGDVDLQNRKDLLPTYYESGIQNNDRIRTNSTRTYASYHDTYCANNPQLTITYKYTDTYGNLKEEPNYPIYCDGENNNPGIIRVVNPAKIR